MELNSNQIQEILPHRYPFQLVDRITDFEPGKWAKGVKCVSVNEMQFLGHFPTQHVIEMECEITDQKGPIGSGKAVAKVDGKVAVTAELTFVVGA